MFKAYGFNLREEDYDRIGNMIQHVTNEPYQIYDLRSFEPEIEPNDILFVYGARADRECEPYKCLTKIVFPDIVKLDPILGDAEERKESHSKLLAFKETLDLSTQHHNTDLEEKSEKEKQIITEDALAFIKANKIEILESILRQQGSPEWVGRTIEGKSIRISLEPQKTSEDINLTFAEMYALIEAMDRLRVKELEIVYKSSSTSSKNNNQ